MLSQWTILLSQDAGQGTEKRSFRKVSPLTSSLRTPLVVNSGSKQSQGLASIRQRRQSSVVSTSRIRTLKTLEKTAILGGNSESWKFVGWSWMQCQESFPVCLGTCLVQGQRRGQKLQLGNHEPSVRWKKSKPKAVIFFCLTRSPATARWNPSDRQTFHLHGM